MVRDPDAMDSTHRDTSSESDCMEPSIEVTPLPRVVSLITLS